MGLNLGPVLRQIRKERNISQKELAEMLEMTQANLSLTENGKKGVSQVILDRIEENLGVPAAVLLWKSLTVESVPSHKRETFVRIKPAIDTLIESLFQD
jgi:transcriptional regulator with XRE-family HTH domain